MACIGALEAMYVPIRSVIQFVRPWTRICWWMILARIRDLHSFKRVVVMRGIVVGAVENKAVLIVVVRGLRRCFQFGFR